MVDFVAALLAALAGLAALETVADFAVFFVDGKGRFYQLGGGSARTSNAVTLCELWLRISSSRVAYHWTLILEDPSVPAHR